MHRISHLRRGSVGLVAACLLAALASPVTAATTASAAPAGGLHFKFKTFDVPKSIYTDILGVNDSGVMVGQYIDTSLVAHGFIVMKDGHIITVDVKGAYGTGIQSVNGKGTAVGWWTQSLGDGKYLSHGFTRSPKGAIKTIDDPAAGKKGYTEVVAGINDAGVLVGSFVDSKGVEHGFIEQHGHFTTVNNPKYPPSDTSGTELWGINNSSVIDGLGYSWPKTVKGFTFSPQAPSVHRYSYFTAPGDAGGRNGGTWPSGINGGGAVVGHSDGWENYGVFVGWEFLHGKMIRISDPLATHKIPSGDAHPNSYVFGGTAPGGINDKGTVTGIYFGKNNIPHGFIATPVATSKTAL
ncbi:MAG: hypothetical protein ACLQK4_09060 [Acidimicrobiales bacterium]|jgi:hypothetical protein